MALAADIATLRDRILSELATVQDYYAETKVAWKIVQGVIGDGRRFKVRNALTGTVTAGDELAAKARGYITGELAEATFQRFVAIFENFYFELVRLWLTAHPRSLGKKTLDFETILDLPDKDAMTRLVVGREINEVLYGRPTGWFSYLEDRAKLGRPTPQEVERIAEAKASRDLLAHAQGVANKVYLDKAGRLARCRDGERIDIPEHYHRETWELICKVVADVSDAAIVKVGA